MQSKQQSKPLQRDHTYILPLTDDTRGRRFISHGFTTKSLFQKRYNENTSTAAITINLLLPFLNSFNAKLETHVTDGSNLSSEQAFSHLIDSGFAASVQFADVAARTIIQAALAAALIEYPSAAGNATVYLWDAYARMHRKYIGDLCTALRIPKFVASIMGPVPSDVDVNIYETRVPFFNAFEDSLKRHVLVTISDIIVTNARLVITSAMAKKTQRQNQISEESHTNNNKAPLVVTTPRSPPLLVQMSAVTVQKSIILVGRAAFAAIGNTTGGGKGEYWAELLGGILVSSLAAVTVSKMVNSSVEAAAQKAELGAEATAVAGRR